MRGDRRGVEGVVPETGVSEVAMAEFDFDLDLEIFARAPPMKDPTAEAARRGRRCTPAVRGDAALIS